MPRYLIEITAEAEQDLAYYRASERKAIIDGILTQLQYEPTVATLNRKKLRDNPIATWELRIGKYRVFYEVEAQDNIQENNEQEDNNTEDDSQEDDQATVVIISVGHKEHNVLYVRGKVVKL